MLLHYFFGQIKLLRTPFSPVQIILEDSPGGQTTHNDTSAYNTQYISLACCSITHYVRSYVCVSIRIITDRSYLCNS